MTKLILHAYEIICAFFSGHKVVQWTRLDHTTSQLVITNTWTQLPLDYTTSRLVLPIGEVSRTVLTHGESINTTSRGMKECNPIPTALLTAIYLLFHQIPITWSLIDTSGTIWQLPRTTWDTSQVQLQQSRFSWRQSTRLSLLKAPISRPGNVYALQSGWLLMTIWDKRNTTTTVQQS